MTSSSSPPENVSGDSEARSASARPVLTVGISSRALFDLSECHALFEREGLDAYRAWQIAHEDEVLAPGVAFPLVRKLLALNPAEPAEPMVEVILLSRNSGDTGLRIFNSIQHHGLDISRAAFTSGAPTSSYVGPFHADLFLSANAEDVTRALRAGVAAATILPSPAGESQPGQLRIAFDGDAVIFGDESERVTAEQGIAAFHRNESEHWNEPLSGGPFRGFLDALHHIQAAYTAEDSPIRTALVTARAAPAHKRVIMTLRQWGVRIDEAVFLGGRDKGPFLEAFGADIFFDDTLANIDSARNKHVTAGHVPHGINNPGDEDVL